MSKEIFLFLLKYYEMLTIINKLLKFYSYEIS